MINIKVKNKYDNKNHLIHMIGTSLYLLEEHTNSIRFKIWDSELKKMLYHKTFRSLRQYKVIENENKIIFISSRGNISIFDTIKFEAIDLIINDDFNYVAINENNKFIQSGLNKNNIIFSDYTIYEINKENNISLILTSKEKIINVIVDYSKNEYHVIFDISSMFKLFSASIFNEYWKKQSNNLINNDLDRRLIEFYFAFDSAFHLLENKYLYLTNHSSEIKLLNFTALRSEVIYSQEGNSYDSNFYYLLKCSKFRKNYLITCDKDKVWMIFNLNEHKKICCFKSEILTDINIFEINSSISFTTSKDLIIASYDDFENDILLILDKFSEEYLINQLPIQYVRSVKQLNADDYARIRLYQNLKLDNCNILNCENDSFINIRLADESFYLKSIYHITLENSSRLITFNNTSNQLFYYVINQNKKTDLVIRDIKTENVIRHKLQGWITTYKYFQEDGIIILLTDANYAVIYDIAKDKITKTKITGKKAWFTDLYCGSSLNEYIFSSIYGIYVLNKDGGINYLFDGQDDLFVKNLFKIEGEVINYYFIDEQHKEKICLDKSYAIASKENYIINDPEELYNQLNFYSSAKLQYRNLFLGIHGNYPGLLVYDISINKYTLYFTEDYDLIRCTKMFISEGDISLLCCYSNVSNISVIINIKCFQIVAKLVGKVDFLNLQDNNQMIVYQTLENIFVKKINIFNN